MFRPALLPDGLDLGAQMLPPSRTYSEEMKRLKGGEDSSVGAADLPAALPDIPPLVPLQTAKSFQGLQAFQGPQSPKAQSFPSMGLRTTSPALDLCPPAPVVGGGLPAVFRRGLEQRLPNTMNYFKPSEEETTMTAVHPISTVPTIPTSVDIKLSPLADKVASRAAPGPPLGRLCDTVSTRNPSNRPPDALCQMNLPCRQEMSAPLGSQRREESFVMEARLGQRVGTSEVLPRTPPFTNPHVVLSAREQTSGSARQSTVDSDMFTSSARTESHPTYEWTEAYRLLLTDEFKRDYRNFSLNHVPLENWSVKQVRTLDFNSNRNHRMFRAERDNGAVFIKVIPKSRWNELLSRMLTTGGTYQVSGENYVKEATVNAWLSKYAPGVCPHFIGWCDIPKDRLRKWLRTPVENSIVLLSSFYGQNLYSAINRPHNAYITVHTLRLERDLAQLIRRLHSVGLCHLDLTPTNVLMGPEGLKLVDFAKAAPLRNPLSSTQFESSKPTVGKSGYTPPECEEMYNPRGNTPKSFNVQKADIFMLGVLLFYVENGGLTWKRASPADSDYTAFARARGNLDTIT
ncbi:MAG: hypothetical protein KVP17_001690 [Porospora cf. gigantea B]|uniref:uncharacterized protein n=1 Tax=Porospora cf. gigantea B TaxID=2853592 RepID=UPI00357199D0|nr:MAG: hypothetical protein KVP17_001690 [Porospora cf. gigantea B]